MYNLFFPFFVVFVAIVCMCMYAKCICAFVFLLSFFLSVLPICLFMAHSATLSCVIFPSKLTISASLFLFCLFCFYLFFLRSYHWLLPDSWTSSSTIVSGRSSPRPSQSQSGFRGITSLTSLVLGDEIKEFVSIILQSSPRYEDHSRKYKKKKPKTKEKGKERKRKEKGKEKKRKRKRKKEDKKEKKGDCSCFF